MAKEGNSHEEKEVTASAMVVLARDHRRRRLGIRKARRAKAGPGRTAADRNDCHGSADHNAPPDSEADSNAETHFDRAAGDAETDCHARPGSDRRAAGRFTGIQGDNGQL